jgi:hypothetical protein
MSAAMTIRLKVLRGFQKQYFRDGIGRARALQMD